MYFPALNWNSSTWYSGNWEGCSFFEAQLTVSKIDPLDTKITHPQSIRYSAVRLLETSPEMILDLAFHQRLAKHHTKKLALLSHQLHPRNFLELHLRPSKKRNTQRDYFLVQVDSNVNWQIQKKKHTTSQVGLPGSPLLITFRQRGVPVPLALAWPVLRWLMALGLSGRCPRSLAFVGANRSPPTQDAGHHQDYYIFSRESRTKSFFAAGILDGGGGGSNISPTRLSHLWVDDFQGFPTGGI